MLLLLCVCTCWAMLCARPVAEAVVQEAVEAAKGLGPMGSRSGRGLPQIERIRLNVHANQVRTDCHDTMCCLHRPPQGCCVHVGRQRHLQGGR